MIKDITVLATQILLTYETNLDVDSASAPFAERLAAMIKTIETLGVKNAKD